jgi:hypothetical protein
VYSVESADSPGATNWIAEVTGLAAAPTNQWTVPLSSDTMRVFRVRADASE